MGILLLVGFLIEGCMSEHARAAASTSLAADLPEHASDAAVVAANLKSASIPQPNPQPSVLQSAVAVSKMNIPSASCSETVYVVKSGDTLTRIARTHRTTVKTILAANNLVSDRIAVGTKLRLPEI
jgi:LysM repeat protein